MPARVFHCDVTPSAYCDVTQDNTRDVTEGMLVGGLIQPETERQHRHNDHPLLRAKRGKSLDSPLATITNSPLRGHGNAPLSNSTRLRASTLVPLLARTRGDAVTRQDGKYVRQNSAPRLGGTCGPSGGRSVTHGNAKQRSESLGDERGRDDTDKRHSDSCALERQHVHDVYDRTAHHFGDARYRAWPHVRRFLARLPPGAIVADVGCGHGKYLHINKAAYKLASDHSAPLAALARSRDRKTSDVMVCDNLALPYRSGSVDAVISIGVIHHFSTVQRRVQAVQELARVLSPGGTLMIYVWALEQQKRQFKSQDVLVPWHLKQRAPARSPPTSAQPRCHGDRRRGLARHQSAPCLGASDHVTTSCMATSERVPKQQQDPAATMTTVSGAPQDHPRQQPQSGDGRSHVSVTPHNQSPIATEHISVTSSDVHSAHGRPGDCVSNGNENILHPHKESLTDPDTTPNTQARSHTYQPSQPTSSHRAHAHSTRVQHAHSEFVVIETVMSPHKQQTSQTDLSSHVSSRDPYQSVLNPGYIPDLDRVRSKSETEENEDKSREKNRPAAEIYPAQSDTLASVLRRKLTSLFSKKQTSDAANTGCESVEGGALSALKHGASVESCVEGFAVREFPQSSRPVQNDLESRDMIEVPDRQGSTDISPVPEAQGEGVVYADAESTETSSDDVFEPSSGTYSQEKSREAKNMSREKNQFHLGPSHLEELNSDSSSSAVNQSISHQSRHGVTSSHISEQNNSHTGCSENECSGNKPCRKIYYDRQTSSEKSENESDTWELATSRAIQRIESRVKLKSKMAAGHESANLEKSYQPPCMRHFSESDAQCKNSPGRIPERLMRASITTGGNGVAGSGTISQGGGRAGSRVSRSSSVSSLSSDAASDAEPVSGHVFADHVHETAPEFAAQHHALCRKSVRGAALQHDKHSSPDTFEVVSQHGNTFSEGTPGATSQSDTSSDDSTPGVFHKQNQFTENCPDKANSQLDKSESDKSSEAALQRYYHVFRQGELDALIMRHVTSLHILESSYDHANWCVVARKRPA